MPKKILLIEDDELVYNLLEEKLEKQGYEVLIATDGQKGLDKLEETEPDLILLDMVMPGKNGFEVMEEVQENDQWSETPIIVLSNSGQPVKLKKAKKLGAQDWLIKTEFDPEEVIEKVKKQIGN